MHSGIPVHAYTPQQYVAVHWFTDSCQCGTLVPDTTGTYWYLVPGYSVHHIPVVIIYLCTWYMVPGTRYEVRQHTNGTRYRLSTKFLLHTRYMLRDGTRYLYLVPGILIVNQTACMPFCELPGK